MIPLFTRSLVPAFVFMMSLFLYGEAAAKEMGLIDGLWVMKKVDDRYEGEDVQEDLYLTLERTGITAGKPRQLDVRWLKKDYGKYKKLIIHFIAPEHAEGVTLLMDIKPYIDDDRWMFFPGLNLIRRVEARDQHSNFMGTDFTYYDLSEREPDEEKHTLLQMEELDGTKYYVIETTPKEPIGYGYSKKTTWVDAERFTKLRIRYHNKAGQLKKQYDARGWQKIDGIWTPTRLVMEDFLRRHKTTIERTNVRYNQGVADEFFLPRRVDCVVYRDGVFSLLPVEQRPSKVWAGKRKAGVAASTEKGSRPPRPGPPKPRTDTAQ